MKRSILIKLKLLKKRYKEIEVMLSEVNVINNQKQFQMLSREYLKLSNIMDCFFKWEKNQNNIDSLRSLLNDREMRFIAEEELHSIILRQHSLEKDLEILLLPEDPNDKRSCFMELKAATGGNEAAIFTGDLFKMYYRYAELCHWKIDIISSSQGDQGGFKEIVIKIIGDGVCGRLKFESGGHRVQRVPKTESQGRIHTSTSIVAVMPELPEAEKTYIKPNDLKIDTFRSSGAGGQHVNTTDSAIRITHIPTGYVVECQDERSQHKNKAKALSILASRIYSDQLKKQHDENSLLKKCLLGSGARSDRNRTYNFPQNRITDHRINLTLYRLDEVLNGKLDILINPIIQEYQISLLSNTSY